MRNYHSQTLNRTFELIYFVGEISGATKPASQPLGENPHANPHGMKKATAAPVDFSGMLALRIRFRCHGHLRNRVLVFHTQLFAYLAPSSRHFEWRGNAEWKQKPRDAEYFRQNPPG